MVTCFAQAAAGEVVVRGCLAAKKGSEALRAANEAREAS